MVDADVAPSPARRHAARPSLTHYGVGEPMIGYLQSRRAPVRAAPATTCPYVGCQHGIKSQQKLIGTFRSGVFRAAPMASEAVLLRGELVAAHITIFYRDNQIVVLKEQMASEKDEKEKYKARLALYEGPNAPSSTKSMFNHRRNKYRNKHGARGSGGSGSDRPVLLGLITELYGMRCTDAGIFHL